MGEELAGRPVRGAEVLRLRPTGAEAGTDELAVEEPLEIRLAFGPATRRERRSIALTMRTPANDEELAVGFCYAEGLLRRRTDLLDVQAGGPRLAPGSEPNVVRLELHPDVAVDLDRLQRLFYTTSSCGVCGKASLEALEQILEPVDPGDGVPMAAAALLGLPAALRGEQAVFRRTGGLHAAALFRPDGKLLCLREDVGRHNALDKLIGSRFLADKLPLGPGALLVSGRASYELVQKAVAARATVLAAVGAPSSLAVEAAARFGLTLVGWLRSDGMTVYTHPERIAPGAPG